MPGQLRNLFRRKPPAVPRISARPDGFSLLFPDGSTVDIRWTAVVRVAAFKRDLFITDELVVAFETDDGPGRTTEVSEEWPGFQELLSGLETGLGIDASWYGDVIQPPFATNFREIYNRGAV